MCITCIKYIWFWNCTSLLNSVGQCMLENMYSYCTLNRVQRINRGHVLIPSPVSSCSVRYPVVYDVYPLLTPSSRSACASHPPPSSYSDALYLCLQPAASCDLPAPKSCSGGKITYFLTYFFKTI